MRHFRQSLLLTFALLTGLASSAHVLDSLQMLVVINDLGNARVAEWRTMDIGGNGTECYICQYNLGAMEVGELQVSDEWGDFEPMKQWDTDLSRKAKTQKSGIHKTSDGPELCWGVGEEGIHHYRIHYTLTKLVEAYDDYDGFSFRFYEAANPYAGYARVVIAKENGAFTPDEAKCWAFGFHGSVNLIDGKIVAETSTPFAKKGETVTVMCRFQKGVFHPAGTVKGSFKKLQEEVFKGSDYDINDDVAWRNNSSYTGVGFNGKYANVSWAETYNEFKDVLIFIFGAIWAILLLYLPFSVSEDVKRSRSLKRLFGQKKAEATEWFRDVPCGGDLQKAYGYLVGIEPSRINRVNQIQAHVLRMITQGLMQVVGFGEQKELQLMYQPSPVPPMESDLGKDSMVAHYLYQLFWNAAGDDHRLQPEEIEAYLRQDPVGKRTLNRNIDRVLNKYPRVSLENADVKPTREVFGLKKFLQEFTLLDERSLLEITLWKEYMVYATLYGIAPQVSADLKKVVPDLRNIGLSDEVFNNTTFARRIATASKAGMLYVSAYETPEERSERLSREARESRESRSSGGGGSSSYGGGGGSRGGGGSGVR